MCVMRGSHFWQFGSIASLATETTDWKILEAFLAQTWPQKRSQIAPFQKFSWGSMSPDALACSHKCTQLLYQSKKAGTCPDLLCFNCSKWIGQFDWKEMILWFMVSTNNDVLHTCLASFQEPWSEARLGPYAIDHCRYSSKS